MKGVVNNALGNTDSDARADLGKQFNELIHQIGQLPPTLDIKVSICSKLWRNGESETVQFNETFDESTLEVKGFSVEAGTTQANGPLLT